MTSYQVRHIKWGVFQGELMGMAFWHDPTCPYAMPEQGYCEFPDYESAAAFRAFLASRDCDQPIPLELLVIEPYDRETSERMRRERR